MYGFAFSGVSVHDLADTIIHVKTKVAAGSKQSTKAKSGKERRKKKKKKEREDLKLERY